MSMHEIEGLVEDSIHLINDSKKSAHAKRELFFNLYRFQQMFDTGYTHFRVKDILLKNKYLFTISLADHPSYKDKTEKIAEVENELEKQRSTWIEDSLCEKDKESNEILVYFDYGSEFWQLLQDEKILSGSAKPPITINILILALTMMQEAARQENDYLVTQWYAILSNCFAEEYLEEKIYKSFAEFLKDKNVLKCKALALKSGIQHYKEGDGYLSLQSWQEAVDLVEQDNLDKQFILLFLLDFKTSKDELLKTYNDESTKLKALNKNNNKQKKIDFIPNHLNSFLNQDNGWIPLDVIETDTEIQWNWYKDFNGSAEKFDDGFYRQFINVTFIKTEQGFHCDLGLQFGKILRWQKEKPHSNPAFWHFYTNLLINFDEDKPANKKLLGSWGFWKFKLNQTEKKLNESLNAFSDYLQKESKLIFKANITEFNKKLFKRDCDKLMDLMENGEGEYSIIPDYVLYHSGTMVPLTFLFNAIDKVSDDEVVSTNKMVKKYYAKFITSFEDLHPEGVSKLYLKPFLLTR